MHHSCQTGKRVRVALKSGAVIVAKFVEQNDKYCLLEGHPRIPWRRVKNFGIARGEVK